jgi:membrane fusion protein (multidrug efflux system)
VLGTQIGQNIIIKSGLQAGDSIVTQGVQNLREGAKIESVPSSPSAPAKQ